MSINIDEITSNSDWIKYVTRRRRNTQSSISKQDINFSTKAIVHDEEDNILILKDNGTDWWDLPGGHLDEGETAYDSLVREIMEETGLEVTEANEAGVYQLHLGDSDRAVSFFTVHVTGEIQLSEEHTDYVWINADEIDEFNLGVFAPVIKAILSKTNTSHMYTALLENMVAHTTMLMKMTK